MRTANPTLTPQAFDVPVPLSAQRRMTIQGVVNRTFVLLGLLTLSASWTWSQYWSSGDPASVRLWIPIGAVGGLVVAVVTVFKKTWSPITAPIYALLEGLFAGSLSALFEDRYPGIVIQAVALTFTTLLALLLVYKSGLIQVTQNFRIGVTAATGGIFFLYLVSFALSFFGIRVPYIHESGMIGIGFSLFVVVIAALNLVLDFHFIERGAGRGAPRYMEWFAAFGLMVTLIWLYIEFLRLLAKLRGRR